MTDLSSDDDFKYFIDYKEDDIIKPLCTILLQMSGYIKYFENSGKICPLNKPKKNSSHFADSEQVKKLVVIMLTLNKSKIIVILLTLNKWGE